MFQYSQSTGILLQDGRELGHGYSGNGIWRDKPEFQNVHSHGPLPRARYIICAPSVHPHLGPVAMALMPYNGSEMFLRGDFFIHGDNAQGDFSASDGCIVMPLSVRIAVAEAVARGDNDLEVVA